METQSPTNNLKEHPKSKSNFLAHFFFFWPLPIVLKGWKKDLTENDLFKPLKDYDAKILGDKLQAFWLYEENFSKIPKLWRCLVKLFGFEFIVCGVAFIIPRLAILFLQPLCLYKILQFFTPHQSEIDKAAACMYAIGLVCLAFLRVFTFHIFLFTTTIIGIKMRVACTSLIYRKMLEIKSDDFAKITTGKIVNILTNDVRRFDDLVFFSEFIWIGIIEFICVIVFLDVFLGHVAISGCVVIVVSFIFQVWISKHMIQRRKKVAEKTDFRIKLMNDIIQGIQAIKMYTWEEPFGNLVQTARRSELAKVKKSNLLRLNNISIKFYIIKVAIMMCILLAVANGMALLSSKVFVLMCIYETIKGATVAYLPMGLLHLSETITAIRRIQDFLLHQKSKPLTKSNCLLKEYQKFDQNVGIYFKNVSAKWRLDSKKFSLFQIDFEAKPKELIGVFGSTGSGKSTLLQAILKEIKIIKGTAITNGQISYASQEPWIFGTSIRQNILFGQDFDADRYQKVINVCALDRDISLLPNGDQTRVGDRGIMLSGGQKARINLARAVYKKSDIYLLDDTLSAVDVHVARHIFNQCITSFLKDKCVILVTHQIDFLKNAQKIYQLEQGNIIRNGTYQDIFKYQTQEAQSVTTKPTTIIKENKPKDKTKEHRVSGNTTWTNFKQYFQATGHWTFTIFAITICILSQIFITLSDFMLTFWINLQQKVIDSSIMTSDSSMYMYIALIAISIILFHCASTCITFYGVQASKNLHHNMLLAIIKSPLTFFNHHSSGRILNRFSADIGNIDDRIPFQIYTTFQPMFAVLSLIISIMVISYWITIPSLVLVAVIITLYIIFQPSLRNLKRTEGITQSDVLSHINATIQGLVTIKAHNCQKQVIEEYSNIQNLHSSAIYLLKSITTSFGYWTDFISSCYVAFVVFSFLFIDTNLNSGNIGLAINQSLSFLGLIHYVVKLFGDIDTYMTSVERVVEYSELDQEFDNGTIVPIDSWPKLGTIDFKSVDLKYVPENSLVLKQVSFSIKAGEKIGIVGRTGAGKTSLISVLFRLYQFNGTVKLDGIDIKTVPLKTVRSKISVIPQDPVLFLGSLRKNLDPFDEFSDLELYRLLEELELKDLVTNLPQGLESLVSERGSNFSVGEKQLLCLVRALLRKNKIIVLDEATANVDLETDFLIQKIIRKKFEDCTVFTIAHRLNTIMDSHKILVMDEGQVVEFDQPYSLLLDTRSYFYGLVNKTSS